MKDVSEYFIWKCKQGLTRRGLSDKPEYVEQLEFELNVIREMGFEGYFLIVADLIAAARERNIPVGPGRGSAAGSLVAYALEITDVDPLKYRLYFERFLNPARVSLPDIDMDFSKSRRDEVLEYVRERYGAEYVAQICTFGRLFAKQAIRDVGSVLELPYTEYDNMSKLVPAGIQGKQPTFEHAYAVSEELKKLRKKNHPVLLIAEHLEGLEKSLSVHAAGVVISDKPITDYIPLIKSKDTLVTQVDMKDVEAMGLVKFDFLGLKNLDIIQDCVDLVKKHRGLDIDWRTLHEEEDPAVFDYLINGRMGGIFQLEGSSGITDLVLKIRPQSIEDLSAILALYRPGPLGFGMEDSYLSVRNGKEPEYIIPELEPILNVTCGQLIYQEQVLEVCKQIAGYSLAEADLMRRAIGKKIQEEMDAQKEKFVQGCIANGYDKTAGEQLFHMIEAFAGYGFNKAHSVAYAVITYITAYLKTHFRQEYFTAMLNNNKQANERPKLFSYLLELREEGIQILPPDVNKSDIFFSLDEDNIRYGLSGIRNVGENAAQLIISARNNLGHPFTNFRELVENVDAKLINVRVLESMAAAGCFDCFEPNRKKLVENCRPFLMQVRKLNTRIPAIHARKERELERVNNLAVEKPKQHGGKKLTTKIEKIESRHVAELNNINTESEQILAQMHDCEPYSHLELLRFEKEFLGFYLSGHPIDHFLKHVKLKKAKLVSTLDMLTEKDTMVRVAGTITGLEKKTAKNKKSYIVFVLEDAFGTLRCTVFSRQLAKTELFLTDNMTVVVTGKLKVSGSSIQEEELRGELIVEMVEPLEGEHSTLHLTMALGLRLDTLNCTELKRCYDLLQEHRGESNLLIIIQGRVIPYEYKPGFDITANEDLIRNLKEIKGASCNIRSD